MSQQITVILQRLAGGDAAAAHELAPLVYQQLRQIAQRQLSSDQDARNWDATELVHEAYMRLIGGAPLAWTDRVHFFATAATAIRRILVDHARRRNRQKRGGGRGQVPVNGIPSFQSSVDLLELEDALQRLATLHARQARLVELRYFGGLSQDEAAEVLGVSRRTVAGDWAMARAWLRRELTDHSHTEDPNHDTTD